MTELLFILMAGGIIGLSYYLGFNSGINKNLKDEVRQWITEMTVSKMAHDIFMEKARIETRKLFHFLGEKQPKQIKAPRLPTIEDFDKHN